MKPFAYIAPETLEEASALLKEEGSVLSAGGTDLVGVLKEKLLPAYPDRVISLKNVKGLDSIREETDGLHLGAAATLADISASGIVRESWGALADAAYSVARPNIRSSATVGGNICQDIRCWYYRYPNSLGGSVNCARKEGHLCSAMMGENRYHSIFGAAKVCVTPCTDNCPAHTDISAYMALMRAGKTDEAARVIMEVNPMPAVTSRVCAHFCMENCNRNKYDETLNVGSVERFLGDHILEHSKDFMQGPARENGKHVSIAGSGPAGLTAAYYLRQAGYCVDVYERQPEAGGCLTYAIPPYRLPKDIVRKFVSALKEMGVRIHCGVHVGEDVSLDGLVADSDSVMLDTGCWKRPLIGLAGEELTRFGLDFLVEVNRYMREKMPRNVVVVGGGNVAIDVAVTAKRLGAENVRMVCLEDSEHMPANAEETAHAVEEGVDICNGWGPLSINRAGDDVSGIIFKSCVSVLDKTGRFNPCYDESRTLSCEADMIMMAIGQRSDLDFLDGAFGVETQRGRVTADSDYTTSVPGIFAAGDVTSGPATVIAAIAAGKETALSINEYCGGGALPVEAAASGRVKRQLVSFEAGVEGRAHAGHPKTLPVEQRGIDSEDQCGFMPDEAHEESLRCFNCGCLAVNCSDMANMLTAYGASVKTSMRTLSAEELLSVKTRVKDVLLPGEIVTEIVVPRPAAGAKAAYNKYRLRDSIDFAILAVASVYTLSDGRISDAKIVLGAASPVPRRAVEAEKFLVGKTPDDSVTAEAAELALKGAIPLKYNSYKIDIAKTMVRRSIEALRQ